MTVKPPLYLIDGSGFIFRAYHALPPLTRPDGTPVGAVMGFCNMMLRALDEVGQGLIAVVFDSKRATNFRNEIYPAYKANRSEPPEDLVPQFQLVRDATKAFGITCIELERFEADDLIAAYTKEAVARGHEVRILSTDKDMMQLIKDGVRLVDPLKFSLIGPDEVMAKFGVLPKDVIDVQALAGDSTDNVPGVPGIGVKTAAELIHTFGSLEALLGRTSEIKQPKRREVLEANADLARISKQLVRLDEDAPLCVPFEELQPHTPDMNALTIFLQEQGFRSLLGRIEKRWGLGGAQGVAENLLRDFPVSPVESATLVAPKDVQYTLVNDENVLRDWVRRATEKGVIAIDTETNHLTPSQANLVGISLCVTPGQACYIPVGHNPEQDLLGERSDRTLQLPVQKIIDILNPLLRDQSVLKIGQNLKYDWQVLIAHGFAAPMPFDDTMVMSYVLDGGRNGHGMDELAERHLGITPIPYGEIAGKGKNKKTFDQLPAEAVRDYAAEDADVTLRLYETLQPRLLAEQRMRIYHDIDKPLVPILSAMEYAGILVDQEVLKKLSADFSKRIEVAEENVFAQAGVRFNLGSPKQLGDVLFNNLGLPGGKKTKTGAFATDVKVLEDLALQGHDIVDSILNWRQLSKLKSTYTDALQQQINPKTGRVHTSFAQAVTNTGRLSSTDPNLQNIPIRTEEGRLIRTAFVAPKGRVLVSIDYSQIELRLIAEMADIKRLQQAFRDGVDIHALTASEVFGIPIAELTPERRRAAKAINFGIVYGISGFGLARQIGTDPGTASQYIKMYMQRFPELANYMERTKKFAKSHGYVETLFGRKCFMPGITSKNGAERAAAERQAINAPIQGTAADLMKMAMIAVDNAIREQNLPATLLLQVHDELVLEVDEAAVDNVIAVLKHAMENVAQLNAPLLVEAGKGPNWQEAH